MKITREQLREDYKKDSNGGDLFTTFHVKWLEERLMCTVESLNKELADLRKEIGILIDDPSSPEAGVIRLQWYFAKEIEKALNLDIPVDIPKLMGLWGQLMNQPEQKNPLWPVPKNTEKLKELLEMFFTWFHHNRGNFNDEAEPMNYVNEFLKHLADGKTKNR